jgi:hypothetical protein
MGIMGAFSDVPPGVVVALTLVMLVVRGTGFALFRCCRRFGFGDCGRGAVFLTLGAMFARDLLMYQVGDAGAIRRVAGSKYLLLVAAVLVVMTSVPRNYDQTYIGEVPWWPVIPLLFSLVSGSFMFLVLQGAFIRHVEQGIFRKYLRFLGLFWMTAPVAWVYGIPVERFLDARGATVANLWLLGIVSVWRVMLLTRVVSVIFQVRWWRAGGWVLFGACVEVVVVLFNPVMGDAIARGMGGMRNSPEQDLLLGVLEAVLMTCLMAAPVMMIAMVVASKVFGERARFADLPTHTGAPWATLLLVAAGWVCAAIIPQKELAKEFRYRSLLEEGDYRAALVYLNTLEPEDWPPAKGFRPDPYEGEVRRWLPGLMDVVSGNEKRWVQEKLLWVFERTFEHRWKIFSGEEFVRILKGVERLDGGNDWIRASGQLWGQQEEEWPRFGDPAYSTNLVQLLEGYGVKVETKK